MTRSPYQIKEKMKLIEGEFLLVKGFEINSFVREDPVLFVDKLYSGIPKRYNKREVRAVGQAVFALYSCEKWNDSVRRTSS